MEPKVIDLLATLKERSIPTIALTAAETGKYGVIEQREELRIKELESVGISFRDFPIFTDTIVIEELKNIYGMPMLKAGIISTTNLDKALVLEYILNHKNYFPKKIIFVDDKRENLESIEKLCIKLGIKYHGFYYTKVHSLSCPKPNEEVEKLRIKTLKEEHRWLIYEELINRGAVLGAKL